MGDHVGDSPVTESSFSAREAAGSQATLDLETAQQLSPMDEHNLTLLDKVHPADWKDPEPKVYDVVVIGSGAGGLVSAAGAAGTGARVALIEEHLMGLFTSTKGRERERESVCVCVSERVCVWEGRLARS